jgi:hypothetical protein
MLVMTHYSTELHRWLCPGLDIWIFWMRGTERIGKSTWWKPRIKRVKQMYHIWDAHSVMIKKTTNQYAGWVRKVPIYKISWLEQTRFQTNSTREPVDQTSNSNVPHITLTQWINKRNMVIRTDGQMNKKSCPETGISYIDWAQLSRLLPEDGDRIRSPKR